MKIRFGYGMFLAMTFSVAGVVAAGAQSGAAGQQSNPLDMDSAATASVAAADVPTQVPTATPSVSAPVASAAVSMPVDNGARPGDSHVRIVRLSDVKGTLSLDRKTGNGFEQTMPNMPIIEGEKLRTAEGYAEIEFEDNSTLRVAPNSLVEFPLLALRSSGAKASTIQVVRGMVYVNLQSTKGNEFVLRAGDQTMTVSPSTHMRMTVEDGKTVVSVFNGNVEVKHGSEITVVTKKETLTLGGEQVAVAKKIEEEPTDAWDKEANEYHARYAQANALVAGGGSTYGLSDLNYYGSFVNGGAFGSFWQPYLAGAGWNPYCNGVWAMYPGAGYSWVSPYPWGWLPYHSGTWSFFPGYGWGWQPGSTFNGLNNVAGVGGVAGGPVGTSVHSPLRAAAPQAPTGGNSLVLANNTPMVFSKQDKPGNFVFQKNSAGLGVPRGSLGSLNKISNHVEQHGSASMQVYAAAPSAGATAASRGGSSGPVSLRSGAPAPGGAGPGFASPSRGGPSASSAGGAHSMSAPSAGSGSSGGSRGGASPK